MPFTFFITRKAHKFCAVNKSLGFVLIRFYSIAIRGLSKCFKVLINLGLILRNNYFLSFPSLTVETLKSQKSC